MTANAFGGLLSDGATASLARTNEASDINCGSNFDWSANRQETRIKLKGCVASEDDRRNVLGMVKAHFPDLEIDDRMRQTDFQPEDKWLGAVGFALKQLNHLKRGVVRLADGGFSIEGESRSAADHELGANALQANLPAGLLLEQAKVLPAEANPFVFKAEISDGAITFAGNVPSDEQRGNITDMASSLMPGRSLTDETVLASGAPGRWDDAVTAGLQSLSFLQSGRLTISGFGVSIEGVALDKETARTVASTMRRNLPAIYEANPVIKWKETSASAPHDGHSADMASGDVSAFRAILSRVVTRIRADGGAQLALR